jgi:HAMP domain-containing protein
MRHVLVAVAAAVVVLAAIPAYAQYGSSLSRSPLSNVQQQDDKSKDAKTPDQKKKDESAYKDAVGRIPDKKFDPWGKVR